MRTLRFTLFLVGFLTLGCTSDDESPVDDGGTSGLDAGGGESGTGGNAGQGGKAGSSAAGTGGMNDKDASTSGGDKDAGGSTGEPGPGIDDTAAEVGCLSDTSDATGLTFGVKKQCFLWDKKDGDFTETEATNYKNTCTVMYKGTLVDECPADERVAYCAGTPLTAAGMVNETKIIYESLVNSSAESVARNEKGICLALQGYDMDDQPLDMKCTGTLKAKVDGALVDFSPNLFCTFKSDGTSHTLVVQGADVANSVESKQLTITFKKQGDGMAMLAGDFGQPGVSYVEGGTAAFGFPMAGSTPSIDVTTFDANGSALEATFEGGSIGKGPGSSGADLRAITDGVVDITFE
jgi:hypothetical protein